MGHGHRQSSPSVRCHHPDDWPGPSHLLPGGTATFEISLGGDAGPRFPLYQGLVQHRAISGHWLGTVGYYATEDDDENKDVIDSHVSSPLYPREWAGRLAEHFFALTRPR